MKIEIEVSDVLAAALPTLPVAEQQRHQRNWGALVRTKVDQQVEAQKSKDKR